MLSTLALMRVHLWLPRWFPEPAAYPFLDASTTVMSFVAMILMAWRRVECWYLWILVDVVGIGLYAAKEVCCCPRCTASFWFSPSRGCGTGGRWRTAEGTRRQPTAPAGRLGMTRGVVIGKFYPPHRGHLHLIRAALAGADEVTVIVCERADQTLPGALRAAWLREMAPQARVIVVEDALPADDSRAWAAYTREVLGYAPDLVFTSETYGDDYARFLGARHVLVDLERRAVPVSATMIRRDPLAHGEHLEPCVRAHFVRRVCVLGAESSGTTTLARDLAAHYRTAWVQEFGRSYYEAKRHLPGPMSWEKRSSRSSPPRRTASRMRSHAAAAGCSSATPTRSRPASGRSDTRGSSPRRSCAPPRAAGWISTC